MDTISSVNSSVNHTVLSLKQWSYLAANIQVEIYEKLADKASNDCDSKSSMIKAIKVVHSKVTRVANT